MKKLIIILVLLSVFFSCEDDLTNHENKSPSGEVETTDYLGKIKSLGFTGENMKDYGSYFVIEDDIVIYKKELESTLKQARTDYLVSNNIAPSVRVSIDNSLSGWTSIIANALAAWNNVNSGLQFTIVTSSPHITIYADTDADCPSSHRNLDYYVCAMATFPSSSGQPGTTISVNVNSTFMTTYAQKLKVITHEFGHCIGFRHTNWQARGESYASTISYTPSSDNSSIMNGGECGLVKTLSDYDRVGLSQLYRNGEVSCGTSADLDRYRSLYGYCLVNGKSPENVVAVAIAKSNDRCYVWYSDYTVTSGKSNCLDFYRGLYTYSLAPGKTPGDVIDIGIASNDRCYVWYKDGTVSSGTSSDLDYYRGRYYYTTTPGKTPSDIAGIGIASNDYCYAWYKDGTVTAGWSGNLDSYRAPYYYYLAPGKSRNNIVGMGIASNDYCYVWSK